MFRTKPKSATLLFVGFLLLALAAPAVLADPPGIGGQVFGNGRFKPAPGAVVFAVPGDGGYWAPNSKDNHDNIQSLDQVVAKLKEYPDRSVVQLVFVGHGSEEGGVGTKDGTVRLTYAALTDQHAAVIKAKLAEDASVVLLGCKTGCSDNCHRLAAKLERIVIGFTEDVSDGIGVPLMRSVGANRTGDWVRFFPFLPPDRTLIVNNKGCICILLDGGRKRWICSEVWDRVLHKPERDLVRLPDEAFEAIPAGALFVPDGTIFRNTAGCICLVWGGQKRWVSGEIFPLMNMTNVIQVPDVVFDGVATGPPVDADLARSIQKSVPSGPPPKSPGGRGHGDL